MKNVEGLMTQSLYPQLALPCLFCGTIRNALPSPDRSRWRSVQSPIGKSHKAHLATDLWPQMTSAIAQNDPGCLLFGHLQKLVQHLRPTAMTSHDPALII